jgi:hypothetical protein
VRISLYLQRFVGPTLRLIGIAMPINDMPIDRPRPIEGSALRVPALSSLPAA